MSFFRSFDFDDFFIVECRAYGPKQGERIFEFSCSMFCLCDYEEGRSVRVRRGMPTIYITTLFMAYIFAILGKLSDTFTTEIDSFRVMPHLLARSLARRTKSKKI